MLCPLAPGHTILLGYPFYLVAAVVQAHRVVAEGLAELAPVALAA